MASTQKNLRLPQATIEQLKWLASKRYTNEGTAVAVAVRKLYDSEKEQEKETK